MECLLPKNETGIVRYLAPLLIIFSALFSLRTDATTWVPIINGDHFFLIPIDDPPVAQADAVDVTEDVETTIDVLANDNDENPATLSIQLAQAPIHGLLTLNADGRSFNYAPDVNYNGADSFRYSLTDEHNNTSDIVTVSVNVVAQNDQPMAVDTTAGTNEDIAVAVTPVGSDGDGDTLTPVIASQPQNGSVSLVNGEFIYQPSANFNGSDSFTYTLSDGTASSQEASVTITITPVNDAPVWDVNSPVFGNLTAIEDDVNFWQLSELRSTITDVDGDDVHIVAAVAANGSFQFQDDVHLVYRPDPNFFGSDQITLFASNGASDPIPHTFSKYVQFERDTAIIYPEFIGFSTDNNATFDIHVIEPDGDPKQLDFFVHNESGVLIDSREVTAFGEKIPGEFRYRYRITTLPLIQNGQYTLTATTNDPDWMPVAMTPYSLTVSNGNNSPVAYTGTASTFQNTPLSFDVAALSSDPDAGQSQNLTIRPGSVRIQESNRGFVGHSATTINYTPEDSFTGITTIVYEIQDPLSATGTGVLTVSVNERNTAPVANKDDVNTSEDTSILINVLANDNDKHDETSQLKVSGVTSAAHTTTIEQQKKIRFTPDANFNGTYSFTYTLEDTEGLTATGTVNVTVNPVDDAPEISGAPSTVTSMGESYSFAPAATDIENDTLTFGIVNKPAWANFDTATGRLWGAPTIDDVGQYHGIIISVKDASTTVSLAAFSLVVNEVNVPPEVQNWSTTTQEDTAILIDLLSRASDINGDPLTIDSTAVSSGTLTGDNLSTVRFLPSENQSDDVTINYTVSDGQAQSSGVVTVTVTPVNDAPVINTSLSVPSSVIGDETYSYQVDASDVDSDTLTYALEGAPTWLSIDAQGLITGNPAKADVGPYDGIRFTVTDNAPEPLTSRSQTFSIQVTVYNTLPVISGTPVTSLESEQAYSFTPIASDADEDDTLTFAISNKPEWASFDTTTGSLSGTPVEAQVGTTSNIVISVTDGYSEPVSLDAFNIDVLTNKKAPEIQGTPDTGAVTLQAYSFTPTATDENESDTLTFAIANKPTWASFDVNTGTLSGTPQDADIGTSSNIIISVTDGDFEAVLDSFDITVVMNNRAPVIQGTPDTDAVTLQAYSFTPTATDENENDTLMFAIANKPTWASFDVNTGTLSGTPQDADIGTTSNIIISVTDGDFEAVSLEAFDITVVMNNRPPEIQGTPDTGAVTLQAYSFTPTATDENENDTLTFAIVNQPAWTTFNSATGTLSGTPQEADVGTTIGIVISVTDGHYDPVELAPFSVDVVSDNVAPSISGSPSGLAVADQFYSFTPTSSDDNADTLNFTVTNKPVWTSFDTATGTLSGTPSVDNLGVYSNIAISVTDGRSASVALTPFSITVEPANAPPVISGTPATSVNRGQYYSFTPEASDADGDSLTFSIENEPDWTTFDENIGQLSGMPTAAHEGTHSNITISVTDGKATSVLNSFSLTVLVGTTDWATTGMTPCEEDDCDVTVASGTSLSSDFNGAINGSAGVSGGAGVYTIPVVVPPGRNGVQPDVSLNFSSRSGAGIAGVGWSLSAGSSISRCPRTIAQDGMVGGINYDLNDRLCLDGQRLVPITGSYGAAGTTYTTETESFVTVTQNNAALNAAGVSFTVTLPNGGVREYGTSSDSRVIATHKTQALSWLIDSYVDVTGDNSMTYHYTGDLSAGEVLLDKITYTETNTEKGKGNRVVSFIYQDDVTFSSSYVAGGLTRSTQRLSAIETLYDDTLIRRYDLDYKTSAASGRSLLTSVKETGYASTEGAQERSVTTFTWEDSAPTIKQEVMMAGDIEPFPAYEIYNPGVNTTYVYPVEMENIKITLDVDGNGVRDWYNDQPDSAKYGKVYHLNAEGRRQAENNAAIPPLCTYNEWTFQRICQEADFNVDGMTDGFSVDASNKLQFYFSRPNEVLEPFDSDISMNGAYIETTGDYNGDGYPDIVIKRLIDGNFEYQLHTFDTSFDIGNSSGKPFDSDYEVLFSVPTSNGPETLIPSSLRDAQFVGDMNNDGVGDYAIYGQVQKNGFPQPTLLELEFSSVDSNGNVTWANEPLYFSGGEDETQPEINVPDEFAFSSLVDVNGDGLKDWLGYLNQTGRLHYRINRGDGTFDTRKDLGLDLDNRKISAPGVDVNFDAMVQEPMFKASFAQVDIDGDGKPELLMPDNQNILIQACITDTEYQLETGTSLDITRCGNGIEQPVRKGVGQYEQISTRFNRTIYKFKALKFTEIAGGDITAEFVDTDYQGTPADVQNVDAYGNGLQDMVYTFGCNRAACSMTVPGSGTYAGNNLKTFVNRNYGAGKGTSGGDYMPLDMMTSVDNGVGIVSTWDYRPLSSDKYSDEAHGGPELAEGEEQINSGPFYEPERESYEDGEHFNFASSMYVVGSFKQSNGVGGENETRYQYSGAVYNTKGRGFRGFKSITERDVTNETTTYTEFWQKFPFSSAVKSQTLLNGHTVATSCVTPVVPELRDIITVTRNDGEEDDIEVTQVLYADHTTGTPTAASSDCPVLSQTLNWHDENAQYTGLSDDQFANEATILYRPRTENYRYDPNDYSSLQVSTTESLNLDGWGNAGTQTTTVTDAFGTYQTIHVGEFSGNSRNWPGRYASKAVIRKKVVRHSGLQLPEGLENLDYDKVVKTSVVWNTEVRKPESVTVEHGEVETVDAEDIASLDVNTATITTTHYNDYGLPTGVVVQGSGIQGVTDTAETQYRAVFTQYSDDGSEDSNSGYFPLNIRQRVSIDSTADAVETAFSALTDTYLETTTLTDPTTGLPTSVEDVSGVTTTTTYDSLARPVSITRTGYPTQYLGYYTAVGESANAQVKANKPAANAIMAIRTSQVGAPASVEYKDKLGRTLRSASQVFDGTYAYQDIIYNARGLVTSESNLHQGTAVNTEYSNFDVLGRPGTKVTPATRGELTTTYTYTGLKTTINVAAEYGDISSLEMERSYNSLEQLMETVDANNGITHYAYDGSGNPVIIQDAVSHKIVAKYDALGRKEYVQDPNMGLSQFTYNDFGELEKELAGVSNATDSSVLVEDDNTESVIRYDMDLLGRVTSRHTNHKVVKANGDVERESETASFDWDSQTSGLLSSQSVDGASTHYTYDSAARVLDTTVNINGRDYVTSTRYNNKGQAGFMYYPAKEAGSGRLAIEYEYNDQGYLTHEKNAANDYVYREITAQDALGNITRAVLNGSLESEHSYHAVTGQMLQSRAGTVHDVSYYHNGTADAGYDSYGNLVAQEKRIGAAAGYSHETYTYDNLHRLTNSTVTYTLGDSEGSADIAFGYDAVGNITKKSDYSEDIADAYQYNEDNNQLISVALKDNGGTVTFGYDNRGNQTHRTKPDANTEQEVWYNAFNKPTKITKNGENIQLFYGADIMRYKQTRIVREDGQPDKTVTTWYIGKHFEVEVNEASGVTTSRHFISDVAIVNLFNSESRSAEILYTHRDRLGSAITMTNEHNHPQIRRFFDAFGKPRNGGDWSLLSDFNLSPRLMNLPGQEAGSYKGFTDHEHLDDAELIHMNGRVYDYNVGRFMSVDPVIQSPGNSQSINPYSYIMNNPMAGTDPTGYCAAATGSNIRDCGDLQVDVEITMADGSVENFSVVVQDVNFANGMDVNQGMLSGTMTAVSQSIADTKSEASKAQNQPVGGGHSNGPALTTEQKSNTTKKHDKNNTVNSEITPLPNPCGKKCVAEGISLKDMPPITMSDIEKKQIQKFRQVPPPPMTRGMASLRALAIMFGPGVWNVRVDKEGRAKTFGTFATTDVNQIWFNITPENCPGCSYLVTFGEGRGERNIDYTILEEYFHVIRQWNTGSMTKINYLWESRNGYENNKFEIEAKNYARDNLSRYRKLIEEQTK